MTSLYRQSQILNKLMQRIITHLKNKLKSIHTLSAPV